MIEVTSEVSPLGTIQHCEVKNHTLAVCLFEKALEFGLEPDFTTDYNGSFLVEFYADDEVYTQVFHAAQDAADEERIANVEAERAMLYKLAA